MTAEQQLPEGWETQPLQNLLSYVIGGDWGKDENYDDENFILVNCIRGAEFRNWKNDKASTAALRKIKISSLQNRQIQEDDILIEISGGGPEQPVGRTVLITKQVLSNFNNPVVCTNFLRLIRPNEKINSTFLNYYLSYFYLSGKIISYQAGSNNLRNLKFKEYERIEIPVPPIETQQAIVNKIESLFDEIDEGIGRLKTAAQQIQQYRQSLLKNAFNGELTKEWRSKHADTLPSENELLAQIQTAREQHLAQQLADWQTAVSQWEQNGKEGKKPSKPSTLKKLESIEKLNEIELTELPEGWFWERLGLMTLGVEYGTSAKSQPEGKVPVLRMGNMQNGKIDWADLVYSDNDEEIKQYLLKKGDVLFNRTNSPELVGKTSIIETDEKAIFAGYLIRINHLTEITDGRYLTYFLNSMIAKKYGNFVKTDGVNQSNINGQKLINYPFVFCSLKEQKEIADILEQKFTACDQLADEIAKQLKQAELFKQAVLKAAFQGELIE